MRWCTRVAPDYPKYQAAQVIELEVKKGAVLLEFDDYRYIRTHDLVFPCKFVGENNGVEKYLVQTVLTNEMTTNMQVLIDKYV